MSYDTYIIIDSGGAEPAQVADVGNHTSNVSPMYHQAMPGPYEGGGRYDGVRESEPRGGLPGISGLSCAAAIVILRKGIRYMEDNREKMLELNPENGWGSYDTALKYLREILDACLAHPKGFVAVGW
jgi:hypothetical protein